MSFYDAGCAFGRLTQDVLEGREYESVAIFKQRRLGGSKLIKDGNGEVMEDNFQ